MSKIFLVSGFLGSGKTTFIKALVEYFSATELKTALVINEMGEIGIDNRYMKRLGHNIWELFGGCICCTLAAGLVNTLEQLKKYEPDVILIEPSGEAEPKITIDALINMGIDRSDIKNFFLLDTTRLEMFMAVLQPLIFSSIDEADVILINKSELVDDSTVKEAYKIVQERRPDVLIIKTDKNNLINEDVTGLLEKLLTK